MYFSFLDIPLEMLYSFNREAATSIMIERRKEIMRIYFLRHTIWCTEVEQALKQFSPDVVILNAGAATYATGGGPITMDEEDICQVCRSIPAARVVAVHMETVNHCRLTRAMLRTKVEEEGLERQVCIPQDGDRLTY